MKNIYGAIQRLILWGVAHNLIEKRDIIYCRNQMLGLLGLQEYIEEEACEGSFYEVLDYIGQYAIEKGLIEDSLQMQDVLTSQILNTMLDKPSVIQHKFQEAYEQSPEEATHYFYQLSQATNYIKVDRIEKNKKFGTKSPYGHLQMTINLSKPEKDPKEIARAKEMPQTHYPKCLLCVENEGYKGHINHPDRGNHRIIEVELNGKMWGLQYSPYLYYPEHCILLSSEHEPMSIGKHTFENLLAFVNAFPHYFIGSNADLPIVGGSILTHEHYQGGRYDFPMNTAEVWFEFEIERYKGIQCQGLKWPLSTLRLKGNDRDQLVACSEEVLAFWRGYSDESAGIRAYTGDVPHNTITPIAHKEDDLFVIDLVLRNNRTSEAHPMGIFHPHEDVHHIKKENIGLIEVMGLAILPGRLLDELEAVKKYVAGECVEVPPYHKVWAKQLKDAYTNQDLDTYIQQAVGDKFTRVLEDAGVFKLTEKGRQQFSAFIQQLKNN